MQVLRTIRETDQAVCIMLVTGQGDVQTAIEAVREGADGYIDKDELMRQAQQATFRHHLERSLSLREGIRARRELELIRADLYAMVTPDGRAGPAQPQAAADRGEQARPDPDDRGERRLTDQATG
ncbi:MAG: hypothetical protein C4310_05570 [Chloroflexota bacterium]